MRCPNCHTATTEEDMYCRLCGADLVETSTSIVPVQKNLPALLYNSSVPRRVAAGVGALAVGVGIELLRRNMLARLLPTRSTARALPSVSQIKETFFPQSGKAVKVPKGYEIHETVIYMTRIIRRED